MYSFTNYDSNDDEEFIATCFNVVQIIADYMNVSNTKTVASRDWQVAHNF